MSVASIAKKLQIKEGKKILVLNSPKPHAEFLGDLPAGASIEIALDGHFDVVLAFFSKKEEVDKQIQALKDALAPSGILWIAYPKGTSKINTDLNRDILREYLETKGLRAVSLVAVDANWSAMRYKLI